MYIFYYPYGMEHFWGRKLVKYLSSSLKVGKKDKGDVVRPGLSKLLFSMAENEDGLVA